MDADLDLLCISVYCTADDLLPERARNARRKLSDAEVVTLCVAQVLMGVPSDRRFLRAARRQLGHLFPYLPSQDALHKRRARLAETIEWLLGVFAAQSPGSGDTIVCDKGYAGHEFAAAVSELGATLLRPARRDERQRGPHLAPIRQRIESVFFTCKDLLSLERHGARTPRNLFARIAVRLLALTACISLNHQLGRPSQSIADYTALQRGHKLLGAADVTFNMGA